MSELTTIARPYAKAIFELAIEKNSTKQWQAMLFFASEVVANPTVTQFLKSSASTEETTKLFLNLCGEQLDENGQNLIKVMAENQRLLALPSVLAGFEIFLAEYSKEADVQVTSAVALSDEQIKTLTAALEKRLEKKVKLHCSVDASIISGLVVQTEDTVIDMTTKGKLGRLSTALQA